MRPHGLGVFDCMSYRLVCSVLNSELIEIEVVFGATNEVDLETRGYREKFGHIAPLFIHMDTVGVDAINTESVLRLFQG